MSIARVEITPTEQIFTFTSEDEAVDRAVEGLQEYNTEVTI